MVSLIDPALRSTMLRSGAGQGLMSLGAGLMAHGTGGGPQALQQGITGLGQAMDPMRMYQAQMIQNQLQESADARKSRQMWDENLQAMINAQTPQPALGPSLVDMPGGGTEPGQVQTSMLAPPIQPSPETVAGGYPVEFLQMLQGMDPRTAAPLMARMYQPQKPQKPFSTIGQLIADREAGRISDADFEREMQIRSRPQTQINMPGQAIETAEAKKVGEYYGQQYTQLQDAAGAARRQISNLEALDTLLNDVYTGTGGSAVLAGKKLARMLGADPDNIGSAEAAVALANEQALQLRNPAGGAGMPGAMSDRDRDFLTSMVPGIDTTPEGRKITIEVRRRMANRDIEVARMARDYRRRNGRLDEGFYDELDAKFRDSDMFGDLMEQQQGQQQGPSGSMTATNPETGERMRYNQATGEWEPM